MNWLLDLWSRIIPAKKAVELPIKIGHKYTVGGKERVVAGFHSTWDASMECDILQVDFVEPKDFARIMGEANGG